MWPRATSSMESAITSRLTSEVFMPSLPIVIPSEIAIVLNSIGLAPAALYVLRWHIGPLPTTLLETMIWITLALYVFTLWRRRGPLPGRTPFDIPIALFLVAGVIGVIVPPDHRGALGIFRAYLVEP